MPPYHCASFDAIILQPRMSQARLTAAQANAHAPGWLKHCASRPHLTAAIQKAPTVSGGVLRAARLCSSSHSPHV